MIDYKWIGIPYKKGGRDFNGCDCFGLFLLWYKENLNIILPDFTDAGIIEVAKYFVKIPIEQTNINDVILFEDNEKHIGIAINNTQFLHNTSNRGTSVISTIDDFLPMISGVYRCVLL
jgi:cell wall-associated NlpC family hydrolase